MSAELAALARAHSLVALRRWQDAIDALGPAVASSETAAAAHCLRAQCQLALGDPRGAEQSAKAALAVDPSNAWAYRLLSSAYLGARRRRAARDAAKEALRLDPDSVAGYHVLVNALLSLVNILGAHKAALAAVNADPDDPLAHETLATVLAVEGWWEEVEQCYREALRLAPEDADLALGLADALRHQRRKDEASAAYLAAGRSDPTDERTRQGIARLGIPVLGAVGATILLITVGHIIRGWNGARTQPITLTATDVAVVLAVILLIGAVVATALRFRGARKLPRETRRGLRREHRNAAFGWLQIAACLALMLGIWSAVSPSDGGAVGTAALFVAFAAGATVVADRFRGGPSLRVRWRTLPTTAKRTIGLLALLLIAGTATVGQPGPCKDHADSNCTPHVSLGGSVNVDGLTWKVQRVRTKRTANGPYVAVTMRAQSDREATLLGVQLEAQGKTYHQDTLVTPAATGQNALLFETLKPGGERTWTTVFHVPESVLSKKVEARLNELHSGWGHGYIDISSALR